jgi:outer membrane protein TolC
MILYIYITLFTCLQTAYGADDKIIINKAEEVYFDKQIIIKSLDIEQLKNLINDHLQKDPQLKIYKASEESAEYFAKAIESSFSPNLVMQSGINDYDTYHREVTVNKRVPVKWDNENPVVSNIDLPNGGQGLIWLPRPIAWEKKDINLNTSLSYRSRTINNSVALNYTTPFGLQVNALNYELDYRFHPETYGYPWDAALSSSLMMPLFKNYGYVGSDNYTEIQIQQLNSDISRQNLKAVKNQKIAELIRDYFNLYYSYKKIKSLDSLKNILKIQIEDVDLLIEDTRIPLSEGISIKSSYRQIQFRIESEINTFLNLSDKLNIALANNRDFYIFFPKEFNTESIIKQLNNIYKNNTENDKLSDIIAKHPSINISNYELEQTNLKLLHAENQTLPEINLSISAGTFQESMNFLGHNNAFNALRHTVDNPSGLRWNFNVQYVLPTGKSDDYFYQSALKNKIASEESLQQIRKNISDRLKQYIFEINNSYEQIESYKDYFSTVKKMIETNATLLYEKNRINRYDYYSYLKELESARVMQFESELNFINNFFMFGADMNLNLDFLFLRN